MNLKELGEILGEELTWIKCEEGCKCTKPFRCRFPKVEIADGPDRKGICRAPGGGMSREEAMDDYAVSMQGRWLMLNRQASTLVGGVSVHKEFRLPKTMTSSDTPATTTASSGENAWSWVRTFLEGLGIATIAFVVIGTIWWGIENATMTIKKVDSGYQITMFEKKETSPSLLNTPDIVKAELDRMVEERDRLPGS